LDLYAQTLSIILTIVFRIVLTTLLLVEGKPELAVDSPGSAVLSGVFQFDIQVFTIAARSVPVNPTTAPLANSAHLLVKTDALILLCLLYLERSAEDL